MLSVSLSLFVYVLCTISCSMSHNLAEWRLDQVVLDNDEMTVEEVREVLDRDEFKVQRSVLIKLGKKAFPAYEAILRDTKSDPIHLVCVLNVVSVVPEDRSRFVEPTVLRLADPHRGVRYNATMLLGKIGSSRDALPVVALLADQQIENVYAAANTLAAIGDYRTVTAMDVWLVSGNRFDDAHLLAHVKKCRDELKARLDKEKQQKEKPPGK